MAKNKIKTQMPTVFGENTGFSEKMKAAAIEHADNNILFEIALKHFFCDNPSPTAGEDASRELRVRVKELLVQNALKRRAV